MIRKEREMSHQYEQKRLPGKCTAAVTKELSILKMEGYIMKDDNLKHYGVLGMKWGVRRYQNKDGSLTPTGKKRAKKTPLTEKEKNLEIKN